MSFVAVCSLIVKCMMQREMQTYVILSNLLTLVSLSLKSNCNSTVTNIDDMKCFVDISDVTHRCQCTKEVVFRAAHTD